MTLEHGITVADRRVCTVEVVMVAFDRQTRTSINIPSSWRLE
jgi:acyl-CoA thioesterase FadM